MSQDKSNEPLAELALAELPDDAPRAVREAVATCKKVIRISDDFDRGEVLYFRQPTSAQLNRFVEVAGFRKKPLAATSRLLTECALAPSADELKARLAAEPMLGQELYDALNKAMGGGRDFDVQVF